MRYIVLTTLTISLIVVLIIRHFPGTRYAYRQALSSLIQVADSRTHAPTHTITVEELEELPELVRNYLILANVIGQPHVNHFKITFNGSMRLEPDAPMHSIQAQQVTDIATGKRLFYMSMNYHHLPINGFHHYNGKHASMTIKLLDLITVAHNHGSRMQEAETVTYLNDLVLFAPGALLDESILWETINDSQVTATLTKHDICVTATLSFNEKGQLINFESTDRYDFTDASKPFKTLWSTPIYSYGDYGPYHLMSKGEAIWHYPDGAFPYISLEPTTIEINEVFIKRFFSVF